MNKILLTVLIWLVPVSLFAALAWNYLTPLGQKTVKLEMGHESSYIQRLLPDERVSQVESLDGDNFVTLLDEPVYFSVTPPPTAFETMRVEVTFDPGETPTLELGALQDVAAQAFDFKPLSNTLLENLDWTRRELGGGLALFTRESDQANAETFFEQPPDRSRVAVYKTEYPEPYRDPSYKSLGRRQTFNVSLRGPHEFLTYIKDEDFDLTVAYTDVNRTYGLDEGYIKVFNEAGDLMTQASFRDDDNVYDNQLTSSFKELRVDGENWPEGVYRISLSGTSDIIWRSFTTTQRYFVIKNRVFIGDDVGQLPQPRSTTVFTNAKRLTYETQHVEGLQTIQAGGQNQVVAAVGGKFTQSLLEPGVLAVTSPVGDVKITGEGKYAFSRDSWFDPDPISLTAFSDLEHGQVDYVLANLAPVTSEGDWRVATAEFDLTTLVQENGAYKFALSAPGIHAVLGDVKIHQVQVTFSRPRLTGSEAWTEIKTFVRKLLP